TSPTTSALNSSVNRRRSRRPIWTSSVGFAPHHGGPSYRVKPTAWSVRWVLLHLIEEAARHADIVREAIDGATALPLMATQEDWPETPWIQSWRR
ncbi:MAG: DUF664 domain-containing protein, partial [Candidatus Dormibacteria bacterium]